MIISIKLSVAKFLYKETKLIKYSWNIHDKLAKEPSVMDEIEVFKLDLTDMDILTIKKLRVKISDKVNKQVVDRVDRYIEASENPDSQPIKSIDEFKAAIISYSQNQKTKWFWVTGSDNVLVPYLIRDVDVVRATKYVPRHIKVVFVYGIIDDGEGKEANHSFAFFSHDMEKRGSLQKIEAGGYFDIDESDLSDEEEAVDETKKVKSKKEYLSLRSILFQKGIFYNTDQLKHEYVSHYELWQEVQLKSVGSQYISDGLGFEVGGSWRNNSKTNFMDEKNHCKLVVDEFIIKPNGKGMSITYNSSQFGYNYLPYHLYVILYDITKHREVKCHVSQLIKYVYNKNLLSRLIVDDSVKTLVNALVDDEIEMEGKDIIEGKSGGLVILCYGPPGNGKTLTGEIYSEYVEKPLYQIQSSQLGVDVDTIEKKLASILRRSERWGCILMIDEADTYVFKRGNDMVQNAIVGVLLRLLEYYNGILFLTTNRKDIVDEAIMSRVTVSIPYRNPEHGNLVKIWKTHTPSFGCNISDEDIDKIATEFPMSGRDVRNALKLLSKYYKNGEVITTDSIKFIQKYLPSIE